jgi:hypothetical protein
VPDVSFGSRFLPHGWLPSGGHAHIFGQVNTRLLLCLFMNIFFSNGMESKVEEDKIFELHLSEISTLAEAGMPTLV